MSFIGIEGNRSTAMETSKMIAVRGWCIAIIAVTSSLAMMHGDTTLVSEQVNKMMGLPNYIASIIFILTIQIKINYNKHLFIILIQPLLRQKSMYIYSFFRICFNG